MFELLLKTESVLTLSLLAFSFFSLKSNSIEYFNMTSSKIGVAIEDLGQRSNFAFINAGSRIQPVFLAMS